MVLKFATWLDRIKFTGYQTYDAVLELVLKKWSYEELVHLLGKAERTNTMPGFQIASKLVNLFAKHNDQERKVRYIKYREIRRPITGFE